jgi:hypothetical protein
VSWATLGAAAGLTAGVVAAVTLATNAASATVVPPGRAWQYWVECVGWPIVFGAPFMVLATLMATRAFPTRPAIAGALCGASAGLLADAGWRLTCWISAPPHVASAHGLAILALTATGSLLALCADVPRWRKFNRR